MLYWRIFVTFTGTLIGVIVGLFIMEVAQGWNDLFVYLLSGALAGAACGWVISPVIPRMIERLAEKYPPIPPPRNVVRFGGALGLAEGVVVGAVYGGAIAAVLGGYMGMPLGAITVALSWRIRRDIPLLVLALFLGFVIEVVGCLLIVFVVRVLPREPFILYMLIGGMFMGIALRLRMHWQAARLRRLRRQAEREENFDPHHMAAHPSEK